jgi:protein-S-isoprenylcysteine O-methyltransferase Ste14
MSGDSPSGVAEAFKRACIAILLGVIAIYFAVSLIQSMWPTLVVLLGVIGLIAIVVGGIIIWRRMHAGW